MKNYLSSALTTYTFLTILTLTSCVYDSNEDIFRNIEPPSTSTNIRMINAQMDGDTLFIDRWIKTDILIDAGNFQVTKNTVYYSGDEKTSYNNVLNTRNLFFQGNQYEIELELELSSNNGSIASELGAERYLIKKAFVVKRVENMSYKYLSEEVVDGKYKLTWPKINSEIVDKYVVKKSFLGETPIIETIETTDNWFIDEYYAGESMVFNIEMIDINGNRYNLWRHRKTKEKNYPYFKVNSNGIYELNWPTLKYTHNISSLSVYKNARFEDIQLLSTSDLSINSIELPDAKFGGDGYYHIKVVFKNKPPYYTVNEAIYTWRGGFVGEKFEKYEFEFLGQIDDEHFLINQDEHVLKYSNISNKAIDSLNHQYFRESSLKLSNDGKHIAHMNSDRDKISIWETADLLETPVLEKMFPYIYNFSITSTNMCLIESSDYIPILYDLKNNKKMHYFPDHGIRGSKISADAEYIFFSYPTNLVYHNSAGKIELIRKWDERDFYYCSFDPTNPSLFYTHDQNFQFTVYNLTTNEIVKQSYVEPRICYVNFYSKKALAYDHNKIFVLDLNTFEITHEIPAEYGLASSNKLFIINNTIYSTLGIKHEL